MIQIRCSRCGHALIGKGITVTLEKDDNSKQYLLCGNCQMVATIEDLDRETPIYTNLYLCDSCKSMIRGIKSNRLTLNYANDDEGTSRKMDLCLECIRTKPLRAISEGK